MVTFKKRDKCFVTDPNDMIVQCLTESYTHVVPTGHKMLKDDISKTPLVIRGMTERKSIRICEKQKRDYYYIDTGYMGNLHKRKDYHRVVKNNVQNMKPRYDLPDDRFRDIPQSMSSIRFRGWRRMNGPILVVTPSAKPCALAPGGTPSAVHSMKHLSMRKFLQTNHAWANPQPT